MATKFEDDFIFIEPDREGCCGYVMDVNIYMIGQVHKIKTGIANGGGWVQVEGYNIYLSFYCFFDDAYWENAYYKKNVLVQMAKWYFTKRIQKKPSKFKKYKL